MPALTFRAMTVTDAREMIGWRYAGDYAMYNIEAGDLEEEAAYLADPANQYFALYAVATLVGHCCFGAEGRVPGGDYSADALDMGIGMRPDQTGQGHGKTIAAQVMAFAQGKYQPDALRATVAAWNGRAQAVCTGNGMTESSRFTAKTGVEFVIFVKGLSG